MSINNVLNRPIFRKQALRKGHLKVIKANTGTYTGSYLPLDPRTSTPKGPGFFSKLGSDIGGVGRNIKDPRFLINAPFGMGGATTRTAGAFGLYPLIGEATRKLGMTGVGKDVADLGISAALSRNPYAVGAGLLYGGYRAARPVIGRGVDLIKERPLGTTASNASFMPGIEGVLGKPINQVSLEEMVKNNPKGRPINKPGERNKIASGRGAGDKETAVGYKPFDDAVAGVTDNLTVPDNMAELPGEPKVDITKVVNNIAPVPPETGITADAPPPKKDTKLAKIETQETEQKPGGTQSAGDIVTSANENLNQPTRITSADGAQVTDDIIARARKIRTELMQGQSSQAKLVFLANLASGLMSGTTSKAGIGGAMEVFGRALGPAVNNYAMIKLKENELQNEFMQSALEIASDEMDRKNKAYEYPEGDPGVVQFFNENGKTVNMTGIRLKDGTVQVAMPGQYDQNGRNVYRTIPPGQYNRFAKNDELAKPQIELLKELEGKYRAYALGQKSINILREFQEKGETGAGPVGRFNLFSQRLGSAFEDITGRKMYDSAEAANERLQFERDKLINDLMVGEDLERKQAEKKVDSLLGDSVVKDKIMKAIQQATGEEDKQKLSQLAINETVMVYALANSLKSKDRLTEKDIKMAKELVNIFPLLRGQRDVIRDLSSVNNTILGDIQSLENQWRDGLLGETGTLDNFKRKYGITSGTGDQPEELTNPFTDKSTEELLEMF